MNDIKDFPRGFRDEQIADKWDMENTTLGELLKAVPQEEWSDVRVWFEEEGDYYGGTIVNLRLYRRRPESDEEYKARYDIYTIEWATELERKRRNAAKIGARLESEAG